MKKIILTSLLGLAIVISCEKKQEANTENDQPKTEEHATSEEHSENIKLELNNGAKWTMNAEMKPYINEMEKQVNAYKLEDGDFKLLGKSLSETNEQLIKSCTIKGTPHDVLHAWLMPHMELIDHLKKSENREDANRIVGELKESMEKYHQFFD